MRENTAVIRYIAYGIVLAGAMLAFAQAIVPQLGMTPGYRLAFGVFAWAAVPYLVYLFITDIVQGYSLLVPGLLVFSIDLIIAWSLRFGVHPAHSALLTTAPAWLTLVVLPLGILAGRQLGQGLRDTEPPSDTSGE
jgi:hypothetical protein